jgi:4-hydroxy-tetrahydrodipicolinate synthase
MKKKYSGVIIPMITPFTPEGGLDKAAAVRVAQFLVEAGTYPFLLGTTGESASVPISMRIELVKAVMGGMANTTVYAGISDNCLETSVMMAKRFADAGISAAVGHLPSYYPLKPEHMLRHYEMLADRSPIPIIIYNILSTTHMSIPLDIVEKLSHHPNIAGMKDSERDLDRMRKTASLFKDRGDFSILCGWTTESASTLLMGFDGIVPNPGNAIPAQFVELYEAAVAGDREKAEAMQEKVTRVAMIFQKDRTLAEVFPGLKVMMEALGLCTAAVLPPLMPVHPDEAERIRNEMKAAGII